MKIELHEMTIAEVAEGFLEKPRGAVTAYNGKLNIRPAYQREFVYKEQERNAVIDTVFKGYPLNVMYWAKNEDGTFEMIDGQQRTISFCRYLQFGGFQYEVDGYPMAFHSLTRPDQEKILDYKLMIYICEGNDKEKLDWFKIINIAGVKLTDQELRNAVYTGSWLTHAKSIFSQTGIGAAGLGKNYLNGSPIRQEFLETALKWISKNNIESYMSAHQHDPNANELWTYFKNVIEWVNITFTTYRKEMKGLDWSNLYDEFHAAVLDTAELENRLQALILDDDVTNKRGIYHFVLTGNEKHLNIRKFSDSQKLAAYERQKGSCPSCTKHFKISEMEGDHITPWSQGGKTAVENLQLLCRECNRRKGGK
ncbi:MAG: DUF262 domain-containing protein [Turicibacter sp.]|nr:DUF262 domain-containing protein [Turicibacter sp.]